MQIQAICDFQTKNPDKIKWAKPSVLQTSTTPQISTCLPKLLLYKEAGWRPRPELLFSCRAHMQTPSANPNQMQPWSLTHARWHTRSHTACRIDKVYRLCLVLTGPTATLPALINSELRWDDPRLIIFIEANNSRVCVLVCVCVLRRGLRQHNISLNGRLGLFEFSYDLYVPLSPVGV